MKKLLALLMSLLMVMALVGCTKTEPTVEPTPDPDPEPIGEVAGGWTIYEDETVAQITPEAQAALDKALEGYTGAGFTPIALLGTQVVAGTNYEILCKETLVTATPVTKLAVVVVYEDLDKNATITAVHDIDLGELKDKDSSNPDTYGIPGGWTINPDLTTVNLPADAAKAFSAVTEGLLGATYQPIALLGTQVVAGTNYAILATQTMVTAEPVTYVGVMYIYAGVDGTNEMLNFAVLDLADYNN